MRPFNRSISGWDAPLGIALCIVGLVLSAWIWWSERPVSPAAPAPARDAVFSEEVSKGALF